MHKRGQVSVFAIVGIIIIILVALFFFLRNEYGFFMSPAVFLSDKAKPIEDNLKFCVDNTVGSSLKNFLKQGGDFFPGQYKFYQGKFVKYYCTNIPNTEKCLNVMPTFGSIVQNFNDHLQLEINNCADKDLVKSGLGYNVDAGVLTTETTASGNNLLVKVSYDVKIKKDEFTETVREITRNYDVPLEELYKVALDAVNAEANTGFFEQLLYMLNERGQYIINIDKPYPDKIYKINKKDNDYELWFAVEGGA